MGRAMDTAGELSRQSTELRMHDEPGAEIMREHLQVISSPSLGNWSGRKSALRPN